MSANMRVITESGSVYEISKNVCTKYDPAGVAVDAFKISKIVVVPEDAKNAYEVVSIAASEPEVGRRMCVFGIKGEWWISTRVVSIER